MYMCQYLRNEILRPFKEEVEICMKDESQEVRHQAEAVGAFCQEGQCNQVAAKLREL